MAKVVFIYIQQILDAIILLETYIDGVSQEDFLKDTKLQDAVAMRLQLIGELSKKLPEGLQDQYREIVWFEIVGLRNKIAHKYLEIDWEKIWLTLKQDLPELKQTLLDILNQK